jgi:hypothetical protein
LVCAAIAVITVVSLSRYEVYLGEYVGSQDDYIWLYMTGAKIGDQTRSDQLLRHFNALDDNIVHRIRSDYEKNYLGVSAVYRVAAELTKIKYRRRLFSQYPTYISRAMVSGFDAAFVLAIIFLASVMVLTREADVIDPILLAIAGMSLVETVSPPINQYVVDHETWGEISRHVAAFVMNPSFNFSVFGFTPRSTFALCVLGVTGLRMCGWFGASYAAIFLMSFVHQSYSGLLLFSSLVSDVLFRPLMVVRPNVWPFAALTFAWFGAGQRLWQNSVGMSIIAEIAGLLLAIGALLGGRLVWRRHRATKNPRPATVRTMRPGMVLLIDTTVVLALWSAVLLVAVSMRSRLTPEQWLYFWSQINGRWMGIIRPLLFMTAGLLLVEIAGRVIRRRSLLAPVLVALAIGLSVPAVGVWAGSRSRARILQGLEADFTNVDRAVQAQGAVALRDAGIYYAVSKALDTRKDPSAVSGVK